MFHDVDMFPSKETYHHLLVSETNHVSGNQETCHLWTINLMCINFQKNEWPRHVINVTFAYANRSGFVDSIIYISWSCKRPPNFNLKLGTVQAQY